MLAQMMAYYLNVRTVHVVTDVRTVFPSIQPSIKVLVVDDINDTGRTMAVMVNKLRLMGVTQIKTATLYERYSSGFKSDFVGEEISHDEWHKFSWDEEINNA
jgi:hypoxanthine phosphoribosyltransferase